MIPVGSPERWEGMKINAKVVGNLNK